jgi:sugar/nucleoside kinase (ribokinase family)
MLGNFKNNKVDCRLIQLSRSLPTGYSTVLVGKDNEHVVFPVRGASEGIIFNKPSFKKLSKSRWLYLTSLSGDWQPLAEAIIFYKKNAGLVWNPGQAQLKAGLKTLKPYLLATTILIMNLSEASELVASYKISAKKTKRVGQTPKELAEFLYGFGPKLVLITSGSSGAVAFDGNKFYDFKPRKVKKVINTIGVGDAFGSSFIAGLELFSDIDKALSLAGLNAARVVVGHGAQTNLIYKKQLYG